MLLRILSLFGLQVFFLPLGKGESFLMKFLLALLGGTLSNACAGNYFYLLPLEAKELHLIYAVCLGELYLLVVFWSSAEAGLEGFLSCKG